NRETGKIFRKLRRSSPGIARRRPRDSVGYFRVEQLRTDSLEINLVCNFFSRGAMTQLIKIEGVTKIFRTEDVETHALSNIDLAVNRGDYISIAGPSGCGKSTLLSLLGLLDSPSSGKYFLNGKDVSQISAAERTRIRNREIGFVFQAFNLIGDLTVY